MCVLGMKIHMGQHFPRYIVRNGAPTAWDMAQHERSHKPIKKMYDASSKRDGSTNTEIVTRMETTGAIEGALRAVENHRGVHLPERRPVKSSSVLYTTEDNVEFRAFCSSNSSVRVLWSRSRGTFSTREKDVPYIHPVLTVEVVSKFVETEIVSTMDHLHRDFSIADLKRNSTACQLLLVRSYKVDSTSQGLPVHSLTCSTADVEVVGSRARRQRRFDWISINGLSHTYLFPTYTQFSTPVTQFLLTHTFVLLTHSFFQTHSSFTVHTHLFNHNH